MELETLLQSFNLESTKQEVCRHIKELEATITTSVQERPGSEGQEVVELKTQTIKLGSGQQITAQGDALKLACDLVGAWGKSARSTLQTAEPDHAMRSPHSSKDREVPRTSMESYVQKFNANQ